MVLLDGPGNLIALAAQCGGGADFSGANLRSASFWATKIDSKTRQSLRTTAPWWLALGWDWDKIKLLAPSVDEAIETAEQELISASA